MTAAMPTPTSENISVGCANPAIGMLAPVLSAKETPAGEATAAPSTNRRAWFREVARRRVPHPLANPLGRFLWQVVVSARCRSW
jgi:hypothetical protein